MSSSSKSKKGEKRGRRRSLAQEAWISFLERDSVFLLSKFLRNPTVGGLRGKKESCSSGKGFAWVLDLRSLDKLLEVEVSPYLGFILCLSTM